MNNFKIEVPMKFDNPNYETVLPKPGTYNLKIIIPERNDRNIQDLLTLLVLSAAYQIKNELFRELKE